jgi:general secretion pathway protein K
MSAVCGSTSGAIRSGTARHPGHSGCVRRSRGVALLLSLIVLVLVATLTSTMVWHQSRAIQVEAAERARAQAGWILSGALDWARLILREDLRNNRNRSAPYDALDEPWATPLEEARLSSFLAADRDNNADTGPEAFISGQIEDAQARFNLLSLLDDAGKVVPVQLEALKRLCSALGAPDDTADRLAAAMAGTKAGTVRPAAAPPGAGAGVNAAAGEATDTGSNADFPMPPQRLADLAWLGIDEGLLQILRPALDLLPARTPVNINTATKEVLLAAIDGLDMGGAQRLILARQRRAFEKLEDVKAQLSAEALLDPNRASVTTAYFFVSGRLRLEERVLEERSLLVRREGRVDVLRRERHSFSMAPGQ